MAAQSSFVSNQRGNEKSVEERLHASSIIPSKELLALENGAEPEIKYLLGNLLSEEDVKAVAMPALRQPARDDMETVLHVQDEKFLERLSKFTLISGHVTGQCDRRLDTLDTIVSEERIRRQTDLKMRSQNIRGLSRVDNYLLQRSTFHRIKRKLEYIRKLCPSIYASNDDVITMWGNFVGDNQGKTIQIEANIDV